MTSSGSTSNSARRCLRPSTLVASTSASLEIPRLFSRRLAAPRFATRSGRQVEWHDAGDHSFPDLPIKTLADLKGKRIAFGKGSSAHNLLVAALAKGRDRLSYISPAALAPADATAAFVRGSVDAWSIWDPYLALAELKQNARVIVYDKDVHNPNAFYIAGSNFVAKYPALVAKLNAVFAAEGRWADTHHEEVAQAQAEATGVNIVAVRRFVDRSNFNITPVDDEVIKS